ncbi:MAG: preprotein translocase subunit SecE [Gammaproteobacteria bacterium]
MNETTQKKDVVTQGSFFDVFKWFVTLLLMVGAVVGNGWYDDQPLLYRAVAVVVVVAIALGISATTIKGREFVGLLRESRVEMRKVVWPTRQETVQTTLGVVAMVLVVALILWLLDTLLGWIISSVMGS